jgi:competence protein ComEA
MDPPTGIGAPRSTRLRAGVGAAIVLVLLGLTIAILVTALGSHGTTQAVPKTRPSNVTVPVASGSPSSTSGSTLYVHVLGAVARPGLYLLGDGDRAVDAIAAAGGFSPTADQSRVNLARPLVDGEQLLVLAVGEAPAPLAQTGGATVPGGKVNLNTADRAALETLPRVGPAMSQRIIDWRTQNGRFTAVEDLMSVTGVGEKTFEELKDLVTV